MASIPVRCPACAGTEDVVRNGKSTAGHQLYCLDTPTTITKLLIYLKWRLSPQPRLKMNQL